MENQKLDKLDIVQLIENNPLVKLSDDYKCKFIEKIQTKFTESQQKLFVASFYTYLNYNSKNDFVIDLQSIWKWLGFSRKDHCKVVLEKHFKIDIDYKIIKAAPEVAGAGSKKLGGAGLNKEKILMNINTFKKLCLKSDTKKADEIHDYFIKMEETFQEVINEECEELRLQLTNSKIEMTNLTESNYKDKEKLLLDSYHMKNVLYLIKIKTDNQLLIKYGISYDIKQRLSDHKTLIGKDCDIQLIFCIESIHYQILEKQLEKHKKIIQNIVSYKFNDKVTYTELIKLDENLQLKTIINTVIEINEDTRQKEIELELKRIEFQIEMRKIEVQEQQKKVVTIKQKIEKKILMPQSTLIDKPKRLRKRDQKDTSKILEFITTKTVLSQEFNDMIKMSVLYDKYKEWINFNYKNYLIESQSSFTHRLNKLIENNNPIVIYKSALTKFNGNSGIMYRKFK
jgi:hypothetical protein